MELTALLREAAENPEEDAPRLVLADWLDDHGEHDRAEFVRAQLRRARLDEGDPAAAALLARDQDLLSRHADEWLGPLTHRLAEAERRGTEFRRGLLRVTMGATLLEGRPHPGTAWDWVQEVRLLISMPAYLGLLRDSPALASVAGLDLSEQRLNLAGAKALADMPCLAGLRSLNLTKCHVGNKGAAVLAGSPLFANLRSLNLSHNLLGPSAIQALADSRHLAGLESLSLEWNSAGFVGLAALLASPRLTRLRSLNLTYNAHGGTPKGVGPLPPCDRGPSLTRLNLMGNHLGPRGAVALAQSPLLSRLTELDFSINDVRPEGAAALANSPHLAGLTSLRLYASFPGDEGVEAITRSPHLTRLTELDVSLHGLDLSVAGVRALAGWEGLSRLRRLALNVDHEGAALAASPHAAGLRHLSLQPGRAGDEGAAALAASPHLAGLAVLNLRFNRVGPAGARALAASPHLGGLWRLMLEGNDVGEAAAALRERFGGRVGL